MRQRDDSKTSNIAFHTLSLGEEYQLNRYDMSHHRAPWYENRHHILCMQPSNNIYAMNYRFLAKGDCFGGFGNVDSVCKEWKVGVDDYVVFLVYSAQYARNGDSSAQGNVWEFLQELNGAGGGFAECCLVYNHDDVV